MTSLSEDIARLAQAAGDVSLTGNQTVAGVKTFLSAPVVPDGSFTQAKVVNLTTDLATKIGKNSREVNVIDWGAFNNDTPENAAANSAAFQSATDHAVANGLPLVVPDGTYWMTPSHGTNEQPGSRPGRGWFIDGKLSVKLGPNAVIKLTAVDYIDPSILTIRNTADVTIDGGEWVGERDAHTGVLGEFGAAISVTCCDRVVIRNLRIRDFWGDGLNFYSWPAKTVPQSGSGYTSEPVVTLSAPPGGGTQAVARAYLGDGAWGAVGTVHRFGMQQLGAGYVSEPTVTVTGGGGSGVVARAILGKDGRIMGVAVVDSLINKDILVENVVIHRSGRNGVTIGAVDGMTLRASTFSQSDRIAPKAGVDIEPDGSQESARNVVIEDCLFKDNAVVGLACGENNRAYRVSVDNCTFENNQCGFSFIAVWDCKVTNSQFYAGPITGVAGAAGQFSQSFDCLFSGNIVDNKDHATVSKTCLAIVDNSYQITAEGNILRASHRGISITGGSKYVIKNNIITGIGTSAIWGQSAISDSIFEGNLISGNRLSAEAMFFANLTNSTISENQWSDVTVWAMAGTFTNCQIRNNKVTRWSMVELLSAAFYFNSMNGCVVEGNHFTPDPAKSNHAMEEVTAATTASIVRGNYLQYPTTANPIGRLKAPTRCEENYHPLFAAAPTTGTWLVGQRLTATPVAGNPAGWVCTVAGTPGTWVPTATVGGDLGVVEMDSFPGANDDAKMLAALTYAAAQTRVPAIRLRHGVTTLANSYDMFTGMKVVGAGTENIAFGEEVSSGKAVISKIRFTGASGASSLFKSSATINYVTFANLAFHGDADCQIFQSTGNVYGGQFHNLNFYGCLAAFGNATNKFLMTFSHFTGFWTVNAPAGTQFWLGGSDNTLWMGGQANIGGNPTTAGAGLYLAELQGLSKTNVGYAYITANNGWRGLRTSGDCTGLTLYGGVYEGQNDGDPSHGNLIRCEGTGTVRIRDPFLAYGMTSPAGTEHGIVEVACSANGQVLLDGFTYRRDNDVAETVPVAYVSGGSLRVTNGMADKQYNTWTGLPRVQSAGGTLTNDASVTAL